MKLTARYLSLVTLLGLALGLIVPSITAEDAGATFKAKCAMCHGADATGKTPIGAKFGVPDLTSAPVQKQSDAELEGVIAKGRNKMPAYGGKLAPGEINGLVKYIRTLAKK